MDLERGEGFYLRRLIEVHSADTWIAAASAGAGRHLTGGFGPAVGVRRESGEFLSQMFLPTGRAFNARYVGGAPHQFLELRPAIFTTVFVDRHTLPYSIF